MKKLLLSAVAMLTLTLPLQAIAGHDEEYCREYTKDAIIGGKHQQVYGTACLRPDGDWEIMSENTAPYDNTEDIVITEYHQPAPLRERYVRTQRQEIFPNTFINFSFLSNEDTYPYQYRPNRHGHWKHPHHRDNRHTPHHFGKFNPHNRGHYAYYR